MKYSQEKCSTALRACWEHAKKTINCSGRQLVVSPIVGLLIWQQDIKDSCSPLKSSYQACFLPNFSLHQQCSVAQVSSAIFLRYSLTDTTNYGWGADSVKFSAHLTTTLNNSPESKPYKGNLLAIKKALYKRASGTLCYTYGIHKYHFWKVIRFPHCSYDR